MKIYGELCHANMSFHTCFKNSYTISNQNISIILRTAWDWNVLVHDNIPIAGDTFSCLHDSQCYGNAHCYKYKSPPLICLWANWIHSISLQPLSLWFILILSAACVRVAQVASLNEGSESSLSEAQLNRNIKSSLIEYQFIFKL